MNIQKKPSVTVIIINWNSGIFLRKCLEHLSNQTGHFSAINVIDNNSSDDSSKFLDKIKNVTVQKLKNNIGFAAANNLAITTSQTEFIALLNPDAFPEPDWIERLLAAAQLNPEFAAFGSRQLAYGHDDILDGVGDVYHCSGLVWRQGHGLPKTSPNKTPREIFSPCACAALYRREALLAVGGFDEDYFCYVEDVDLGFRLRLAGYKALYVPDAMVYHVGSATTGGQHSDFSIYHGHRNLVWTYIKDMPGILFWLFLPLHILLNIVSIIYFILRGKGKIILRAKRDAIKGLPKMWKKRRKTQRERKATIGQIWKMLDKRLIPLRRQRS